MFTEKCYLQREHGPDEIVDPDMQRQQEIWSEYVYDSGPGNEIHSLDEWAPEDRSVPIGVIVPPPITDQHEGVLEGRTTINPNGTRTRYVPPPIGAPNGQVSLPLDIAPRGSQNATFMPEEPINRNAGLLPKSEVGQAGSILFANREVVPIGENEPLVKGQRYLFVQQIASSPPTTEADQDRWKVKIIQEALDKTPWMKITAIEFGGIGTGFRIWKFDPWNIAVEFEKTGDGTVVAAAIAIMGVLLIGGIAACLAGRAFYKVLTPVAETVSNPIVVIGALVAIFLIMSG